MMSNFVHPGWLWLLLLVPVYWVVVSRGQQGKTFYFAELVEQSGRQKLWVVCYHGLVSLVVAGLIIVLAQPVMTVTNTSVTKEGIDIVLAMDVSYSMQANDFSPNRIEAAKQVLSQFVDTVETDRVGMVVFAGAPFQAVPLTFDYALVASILQRTSTETINQNVAGMQGTAVGDAMLSALTLLEKGKEDLSQEQRDERQQVIILLTDGEANVGVDPSVVAGLAKDEGVRVYTVGIGSLEGGTIAYQTLFGTRTQRVPGVDEASLKDIAKRTDGQYRRAIDESTFRQIFEEIGQLAKTEATQELMTASHDLSGIALFGVMLCLVILSVVVFGFPPIADPFRLLWQRKALFGALLACVFALGIGRLQGGSQQAVRQVMTLLDVSTSMEVVDVAYQVGEISRLDTAKTVVQRIAQQLPGTKIGLGIFAGESLSIVPLTSNSDFVMTMLSSLDARSLTKQGTDVVQAIEQGVARFVDTSGGVLLVLTDGGDEVSGTLHDEVKEAIQEKNITLVFGHIGTEEGGPIPVGVDRLGREIYKEFQGEQVISSIDRGVVRSFVRDLGGTYISIADTDEIASLVDQLRKSKVSSDEAWAIDGYQSTRVTKGGAFGVLLCLLVFIGVQTKRWQEK